MTTGPLAAQFKPLLAAGDDVASEQLINQKDRPGFIHSRHVVASLLGDTTGFGANLIWAWRHGEFLDGSVVPPLARVLLARLFFWSEFPEYSFRIPPADIVAGCVALSAPNVVKDAILAGEVLISRADELGWGYVGAKAIGEARNS